MFMQPQSGDRVPVPSVFLEKLQRFQRQPEMIVQGRYTITSDVSPDVVSLFFARVMGDKTGSVTAETAEQLQALCDELGFAGFADEIRAVLGNDFRDGDMRNDIASLSRQVSEKASGADMKPFSGDVARFKGAKAKFNKCAKAPQLERPTQVGRPVRNMFVCYNGAILDGIIAHLTRKCGGNVHKKEIVKVMVSSCYNRTVKPENLVDFRSNSLFCSREGWLQWICYDFKGQRVTPMSYSIRTARCCYPKSWMLEASHDGSKNTWNILDLRQNNEDMNDRYVTYNFAIKAPMRGSYRFVRLRQVGPNHDGNNFLAIASLEIFGILSSKRA